MRRVGLFAVLAIGVLLFASACDDAGADERNPLAFEILHPFSSVIANPRAVKQPVTLKLALGMASGIFTLDSVGPVDLPVTDPRVRCMIVTDTVTAWDATGRQLDNSIVRWGTADSTLLTVDANGVLRPQRCVLDSLGRADTTHRYVGVTASVPGLK